eukprot:374750-Amphidinium_carterae.1
MLATSIGCCLWFAVRLAGGYKHQSPVMEVIQEFQPEVIVHLAAERSSMRWNANHTMILLRAKR